MAQAMKIAIIDDEQDMRQSISQWLALSGFETETFASAGDALKGLSADYPGIIVTDIKMPRHGRHAIPQESQGHRQQPPGDYDHGAWGCSHGRRGHAHRRFRFLRKAL